MPKKISRFRELFLEISQSSLIQKITNEYDGDWEEYVKYESEISYIEAKEIIDNYQPYVYKPRASKLLKIGSLFFIKDVEQKMLELYAESDDDFYGKIVNESTDELLDLLEISEEDVYISGWECTLKDFQENPGTVYHYTTPKAWKQIQKDGEMYVSQGTGICNRSACGIFTSVDPEEYANGTYGDLMLSLDLASFMRDSKLPKLVIYPEPDVLENTLIETVGHLFNLEWESSSSDNNSLFTAIIGHAIPVKYITPSE